jgi:hypothetical protein
LVRDGVGDFSFAPSGLGYRLLLFTHGLRRGLHSFAASRLGFHFWWRAAAFGALRLLRAGSRTEVESFPIVALPNSQREGVVESHVSQGKRDMGHPRFVMARAESRFLDSARSSALLMILLRSE